MAATAVTPTGVRDGDPGALAGLCDVRGPAVLAYCEVVAGRGPVGVAAAADAFGSFRAAVVATHDVGTLNPEAMLICATRHAAARHAGGDLPQGCARVPTMLAARADRSITLADHDWLGEHLAGCWTCRAPVARFEAADRAYLDPPAGLLPADTAAAIVAAMQAAAPVRDATPPAYEHAEPSGNGHGTHWPEEGATAYDLPAVAGPDLDQPTSAYEVPHDEPLQAYEAAHNEPLPVYDAVREQAPPPHDAVHEQAPPPHDAVHEQAPPPHDAVHEQTPPPHDAVHEQAPPAYGVLHDEPLPAYDEPAPSFETAPRDAPRKRRALGGAFVRGARKPRSPRPAAPPDGGRMTRRPRSARAKAGTAGVAATAGAAGVVGAAGVAGTVVTAGAEATTGAAGGPDTAATAGAPGVTDAGRTSGGAHLPRPRRAVAAAPVVRRGRGRLRLPLVLPTVLVVLATFAALAIAGVFGEGEPQPAPQSFAPPAGELEETSTTPVVVVPGAADVEREKARARAAQRRAQQAAAAGADDGEDATTTPAATPPLAVTPPPAATNQAAATPPPPPPPPATKAKPTGRGSKAPGIDTGSGATGAEGPQSGDTSTVPELAPPVEPVDPPG